MDKVKLPQDFLDKPKWQRFKINLRVLFRRKAAKVTCCETFRKGGVACAGCATLYSTRSSSLLYRLLGKWAKRQLAKDLNQK